MSSHSLAPEITEDLRKQKSYRKRRLFQCKRFHIGAFMCKKKSFRPNLDDKWPDHVENTFRYSIGELKFGIFLHFQFTYFPHDSLQHCHYLLLVHSQESLYPGLIHLRVMQYNIQCYLQIHYPRRFTVSYLFLQTF